MIDPFHADKLTGMPQKQRGVKNLVMMMKNHLDAEMPCCDPVGLRDNHRPLGTEGRLKRLMELGEMAEELLLSGQGVRPSRLLDAGFEFRSPGLEAALRAELGLLSRR